MGALTQLVLFSLCVRAHSSPLNEAPSRGPWLGGFGDGAHGNQPGSDYQPYIYAAIPLHKPLPVLQVLSRRPLSPDRTHEPSAPRPVYVRAPDEDNEFAPSVYNEYEYEDRAPDDLPYSGPYGRHPHPHAPPSASASQDDVTVIYARPNPQGGFTYRRRPIKSVPKRSPPVSTTESPVVLRVHRYRIVRDR